MRAEKKDRAEAKNSRGKGEKREDESGVVEEARKGKREREKKKRENAVSVRREGPLKALKGVLDDRM